MMKRYAKLVVLWELVRKDSTMKNLAHHTIDREMETAPGPVVASRPPFGELYFDNKVAFEYHRVIVKVCSCGIFPCEMCRGVAVEIPSLKNQKGLYDIATKRMYKWLTEDVKNIWIWGEGV